MINFLQKINCVVHIAKQAAKTLWGDLHISPCEIAVSQGAKSPGGQKPQFTSNDLELRVTTKYLLLRGVQIPPTHQ